MGVGPVMGITPAPGLGVLSIGGTPITGLPNTFSDGGATPRAIVCPPAEIRNLLPTDGDGTPLTAELRVLRLSISSHGVYSHRRRVFSFLDALHELSELTAGWVDCAPAGNRLSPAAAGRTTYAGETGIGARRRCVVALALGELDIVCTTFARGARLTSRNH